MTVDDPRPGGAPAEPSRFISDDPAASPPRPSWQPGVVEVEFQEAVRPQLTAGAAFVSPAGTDLGPLNAVLQRHGLQRAEPSFLTSEEEATHAQAVAGQRGIDIPHYGNFVTLYFPAAADVTQIAGELSQFPEVVRARSWVAAPGPAASSGSALPTAGADAR